MVPVVVKLLMGTKIEIDILVIEIKSRCVIKQTNYDGNERGESNAEVSSPVDLSTPYFIFIGGTSYKVLC